MGYYSRVTGRITISPPLTHAEVMKKRDDWFTRDTGVNYEIKFLTHKHSEDTDDGILTSYSADAIVAWTDGEAKFYGLEDSVQSVVDLYPDHEYGGYLHVEGEENGDIWRLYVRDGKTVRVEAEFKWPEGFED